MNEKVIHLLNEQVTKEFYSGYLYLAMSNYYYHASLDGFGQWFKVQFQEEFDHGRKIIKYLLDNELPVKMGKIEMPKEDYANFREPLDMALQHEIYVSGLINTIYGAAKDAKDYRSCQFLDWYLAEQTEEEKNAHDLLAKYDLVCQDSRGLFLLDESLAKRVYTPLANI